VVGVLDGQSATLMKTRTEQDTTDKAPIKDQRVGIARVVSAVSVLCPRLHERSTLPVRRRHPVA